LRLGLRQPEFGFADGGAKGIEICLALVEILLGDQLLFPEFFGALIEDACALQVGFAALDCRLRGLDSLVRNENAGFRC
jgi:hypothetical protein